MSFTKLTLFLALLCVVMNTGSATTCNFDFAIPGVGPGCEMKGGLPSDLFDKYREVFGGVEGLKFVVNDSKGLKKIIQDGLARIQREQQIYSGNVAQLEQDIQSVKTLLGVFPIGPKPSKRSQRATDPLQAIRDELQKAEMALANLSRNAQDNARRQSMTISASEMQIQQQDLKLQTVLQKISDLEKKAAMLPGAMQVNGNCGSASSPSFNVLWNIATISAKVQATTAIINSRITDLKDRIQEIEKPLQARENQLQAINAGLSRLQSGVNQLNTNAMTFKGNYQTVKTSTNQDVSKVNSSLSNLAQDLQERQMNASTEEQNLKDQDQAIQKFNLILGPAKSEIGRMSLNTTSTKLVMQNFSAEIANLKKDDYLSIGKFMVDAQADMSKLTKDLTTVQTSFKQLGLFFSNVEKKVNATAAANG